jgi:catalase
MLVVIAEDGDPVDDPTAEWPAERERVEVGRLELTGPETGREQGGDVLVFDPMRVTDGIEPSDDPILHFRSRAYRVSVGRRAAAVGQA